MMADEVCLDRLFHALADTNRRGMIDRLSRGPASASDLGRPLTLALPSVVKHLQVLEAGGVVTSQKAGRVRTYRLTPDALTQVEAWAVARKAALNAQFDRLEQYLLAQGETP